MAINKVAVIGAGVMGAGIAAQLANAGIEVELLDIPPRDPEVKDRDAIAKGAIEKMLKTKPDAFMNKRNAKKIRPGNTDDNMDRIGDCDLIIEVVPENPAIKSATFKKIDANRKPGSIVASNTSTIPLHALSADQSEQFKKDFVITHFFNPPRYMPLLELVTSKDNDAQKIAELTRFMDEKMGKQVIPCNDTPGFIGNRIGTYWIQTAINEAIDRGLTVEEADAIVGPPMGIPKTGIFGLVDLVGLDLMPYISKSLVEKLPATDAYVSGNRDNPLVNDLIKNGYTGRKGKGGFYRLDANKNKLAIDLKTGAERPSVKAKMQAAANAKKAGKDGIKALVETHDKGGDYAWAVLKKTLAYAAEHVHDISQGVNDLDQGMKLGYNWKFGPFEMLDKLGTDYVINRMKAEGDKVPAFLETAAGKTFYRVEKGQLQTLQKDGSYKDVVRPEGVLLLSDIKRKSKPVATSGWLAKKLGMGAALWDIGDGVLCLEFTSKMYSLDIFTMKMINKACDMIEKGGKYKALVVHNEGSQFSVGANLGMASYAMKAKQFWIVDDMVKKGQEAYKRLKYAKFPVVSAPTGFAFGGGCEILLHSHHVQAHAETYMGLVEVGVGLLPAWGGSTELMTRAKQNKRLPNGPMPAVATVFETISTAKVSTSAQEAKDIGYLRQTDGITMNKSRLLADAKAKALELVNTLVPEQPFDMVLPGPSGKAALNMAVDGFYKKGAATTYDVVVSDKVADVLTGGPDAGPGIIVTQDYLRALERKHFMELIHDPRTLARIDTMLKTGKPLREPADTKKTAQQLRREANRPGFFARVLKGKSAKADFNGSVSNDNQLKRDPKAQVNWPKMPKKK